MATFPEYERYDGLGLAGLVASGQIAAREVLEAAIERVARRNPSLNAVVGPLYEQARAAVASGLPRGPFTGVPYLLKDLGAQLAGAVTTHGSAFFRDAVAPRDSELVIRLKRAGLVLFGKTNTSEFGLSTSVEPRLFGPARNPWDRERSAGGSSGGAAAAVASGIVPIAHGNDAGGSIRIPASFCGLVGLKGSRGRTSLGPAHAEFWHGLCEEGALVRTVRDAAAALDAVAGYMPGDPWTAPPPARPFREEVGQAPGRLRIGFMDRAPVFHPGLHPECAAAVRAAAKLLESLGHKLEANVPAALDEATLSSAFGKVVAGGVARQAVTVEKMLGRAVGPDDFDEWTWFLVERGRRLKLVDYLAACEWFNEFSRATARWSSGGFDVLVTSTMAQPAPELGIFKTRAGEHPRNVGVRLNQVSPFTVP
ncbi:MAG TPA: amidase, partial [Myxococcales bacterium]|nr:amidase [Myxococcales bacterium]